MIVILSDGSMPSASTDAEVLALAGPGLIIDGVLEDNAMVSVPMSLIKRLDDERGPATDHTARNVTVDLLLEHVPGRRPR